MILLSNKTGVTRACRVRTQKILGRVGGSLEQFVDSVYDI